MSLDTHLKGSGLNPHIFQPRKLLKVQKNDRKNGGKTENSLIQFKILTTI